MAKSAPAGGSSQPLIYPTPHTELWFALLELQNPTGAAYVREVVRFAGQREVCGSCGAKSVADFRLDGQRLSPGFGATARLCPTCLAQRTMQGETLSPLQGLDQAG